MKSVRAKQFIIYSFELKEESSFYLMVNQKSERYFRQTKENDETGLLDSKVNFKKVNNYKYSSVDILVYRYDNSRMSVSMNPSMFGVSKVAKDKGITPITQKRFSSQNEDDLREIHIKLEDQPPGKYMVGIRLGFKNNEVFDSYLTYYGEQNIRFKKVRKHGNRDTDVSTLADQISNEYQNKDIPLANKLSESIILTPEKRK